jgi:hypothetical protein
MTDAKTYPGGCHCGRVRFEATGTFTEAVDCNCSICSKRGALWAFVKAPQFKLLQGGDALTDYQFGKKRIHHRFCASCGIGAFSQGLAPNGEETFAINVRCLDDIDVASLPRRPFDGKSL